MKIVRTDCELETPLVDKALREAGHELVLLPDGVSQDELIAAVRDAEILLMCYTPVPRAVIEAAPKLRGIVKYGVGIDAIDTVAAHEHGVSVVNIPEYAEETVAEGAFALMIALAKRLPALRDEMNRAGWTWPESRWLGSDIAGQTVGIVGFGKIGRSMARMAGQGFRANVIAFDRRASAEEMRSLGVTKVDSLEALAAQSDFVTIHATLSAESRGMFGANQIAAMKPTAFLINTARGAIVDETALAHAILEGRIAGGGLDVFSQEPLNRADHPLKDLFDLPNVILSPHLTFYTRQAMERLETETLERCFELIEGREVLIKSSDPRLQVR
ncbi:2-hydroxyacid dehydrogenase [Shimia aestuarii]|uniref:D-3-phosphoglycerate dehydrogenase n=1 Tax=Shimia aestuarii TaxID=254406 RepID=A0A1I4STA5_9RHOB|nr:C-terminal binding protein [Shimia aestuarii]SFM67543.1 D-3-phosphoglycerate dehydrogenase [Shimia aestuarii]